MKTNFNIIYRDLLFFAIIIFMLFSYGYLSSLADLEGMRGLSKNSHHSKSLKVFDKFLSTDKNTLAHGTFYKIIIKEAYIEKCWSCGSNCRTAKEIGEVDSPSLVLVLDSKSVIGDLQTKYFIEQENGASSFQGVGANDSLLVSYIYSYSEIRDKPLKFFIYLGDDKKDRVLLDSLLFRK